MRKVIMATLTFVATFALVAGVAVNGSAQATVLGKTDSTTLKRPTYTSSSHWSWTSNMTLTSTKSDIYKVGGKNRKIDIAVTNSNTKILRFMPVELTGKGCYDDYFDCNGNEVYYEGHACIRSVGPNQTVKFTVKLADSSWWKNRDGVYLSSANTAGDNDSKDFNDHVLYSMMAV
jgi:uncharacterized protein with FMN-binding domain